MQFQIHHIKMVIFVSFFVSRAHTVKPHIKDAQNSDWMFANTEIFIPSQMTKKIMRVCSIFCSSLRIEKFRNQKDPKIKWGKNTIEEKAEKRMCRRNHTATDGVPRKRQHYQEYSLLFEILVLHNNKRNATVSAFLHIDLYINTSIFILLIANVTSKWLVHAQRTCISLLFLPQFWSDDWKKTNRTKIVH